MPVNSAVLRFAKISQNAIIPTKGSTLAAGYDLYSAYDCVVPSRGKACVKTDIQIALPDGCYGRIADRYVPNSAGYITTAGFDVRPADNNEDTQYQCPMHYKRHAKGIHSRRLDFRPEYRKVAALVTHFQHIPSLLLTATATEKVENDLMTLLPFLLGTHIPLSDFQTAPRSGLAAKHFIDVGAGVIDQDYRGNVCVLLFNFGDTDFKVQKGDRIAQLICERIYLPELEECESLDDTERGQGGFGSTGTN